MKTHSYKRVQYQCEECDYCAINTMTMELHLGKANSERLECGLCEYLATDLEDLDTHLLTCEIGPSEVRALPGWRCRWAAWQT
jgi:hypothetical protein